MSDFQQWLASTDGRLMDASLVQDVTRMCIDLTYEVPGLEYYIQTSYLFPDGPLIQIIVTLRVNGVDLRIDLKARSAPGLERLT